VHRVQKNPNGVSIALAVFAWLTIDRLTDHATPSVTICRIYVVLGATKSITNLTLVLTRQNFLTPGGTRLVPVCRRTGATGAGTTMSTLQCCPASDRTGLRVAVTTHADEYVTIFTWAAQLDRQSTLPAPRLLLLAADRHVFMFFVVAETYAHLQYRYRRPFNGLFFQDNLSKHALESLNQSGFNEATDDGCGSCICRTICKSPAPRSREITTPKR